MSTEPMSDERLKLYVASRDSVPSRPKMWRKLRDSGWPIISSWIDEAGPGETTSMRDLWSRIHAEISVSALVILYAEPEDLPLKGAYVEAGMALSLLCPVLVVATCDVGSWANHPLVSIRRDMPTLREVKELITRSNRANRNEGISRLRAENAALKAKIATAREALGHVECTCNCVIHGLRRCKFRGPVCAREGMGCDRCDAIGALDATKEPNA